MYDDRAVTYLPQHADKGVPLQHVKGHSNQDLVEHCGNQEGGQEASPPLADQVPGGDVHVPDHPMVHRHVPQGPVLANALSIPPCLYAHTLVVSLKDTQSYKMGQQIELA